MISKLLELVTGRDDVERVAARHDLARLNEYLKKRPLYFPKEPLRFLDAATFTDEELIQLVEEEARDLGSDAVKTPMVDLQVDYPDAALTFSGGKMLTADDVAEAIIGRAMTKRPVELAIPWSRATLARMVGFRPGLAGPLIGWLTKTGQRNQEKWKAGRG